MKQTAIEIVDVSRRFGQVSALSGITLSIAEGEFFSLLGPSGCGKTTLLRIIAGLDRPSAGRIIIGGQDMHDMPPHRRPVNTVFQSYALFPHLSVFDNVAFGLKIAGGLSGAQIDQRVSEALELVRLPQLAGRFPRELSGGQQQRIAFARAIVNRPLVLLLDEPLSALDPRIREEMKTELARFKRELGITFVMVTHDQSEAFALSDRIAVFNLGGLEQVGTAEQIYEQPRSAFVADFIGHTNVLSGIVSGRSADGALSIRINERLSLQAAPPADNEFMEGDRVCIWIRTHAVAIEEGGHSGSRQYNRIAATIVHRSYQGDTSELIVEACGQQLIASVENAALVCSGQVGEQVMLRIPLAATHVLKQSSERQISSAQIPAGCR